MYVRTFSQVREIRSIGKDSCDADNEPARRSFEIPLEVIASA